MELKERQRVRSIVFLVKEDLIGVIMIYKET
jgi:hypothetical protein